MPTQMLILDPYHDYASRFIDTAFRHFGVTTVCAHTDEQQMRRQSWRFPALRSAAVVEQAVVRPSEFPAFVDHLREAHTVTAVIPHLEAVVTPSVEIAELLDLSWAQPGVLPLFRDKLAMKTHLRTVPNGPRLNRFVGVRNEHDVLTAMAEWGVDRAVLKPRDSYGSDGILIISTDDPPERLRAHLGGLSDRSLLLEEFVGGPEYFVNGQVDGHGAITVTRVGRYQRATATDRPYLKLGSLTVPTTSPEFHSLVAYAMHVVGSTGLRRSPFHLEAKIDDDGPCLIEVGARLAGSDEAMTDDLAHGHLSTVLEALRHYLNEDDATAPAVDWARYDSRVVGHASGISQAEGRIYEVHGIRDVETMPGFRWWVTRPTVGQRVSLTVDLMTQPYEAVFEAPDQATALSRLEQVRSTLAWNSRSPGPRRAALSARALLPVAGRQVRQRLLRPTVTPWTSRG